MATTPTPTPNVGEQILSDIEKVFLGIVAAAPAVLPVFVHSARGLVIANASEALLANVLQQFVPKS